MCCLIRILRFPLCKIRFIMTIVEVPRLTDRAPFWILNTQNTAYAFGIASQGNLEHVYWGGRLPLPSDYEASLPYGQRLHIEGYSQEEFPAWGGYKFNEPALKARFADGVRAVFLQYAGSIVKQGDGVDTLTITLN